MALADRLRDVAAERAAAALGGVPVSGDTGASRTATLPSSDPRLGSATAPFMVAEARDVANSAREAAMTASGNTSEIRRAVGVLTDAVHQFTSTVNSARQYPTTVVNGVIGGQPLNTQPDTGPGYSEGGEVQRRMTFSEGREQGRNLSMRDASQRVSGGIARALSQTQRHWMDEPQRMEDGSHVFVEQDGQGNVTRTVPFDPSSPDSMESAAEEVGRLNGRNMRWQAATGMFGRYAAGEGIAGALGGTAARLAGPIGIGVGLGAKAFDTYNDQLAKGAEFRQIYGEDAGKFAMSQRMDRFGAGMTGFFNGMGRERATEAYTAAAQMGLKGDRLDAATDFDRQMFMQHGMSTEQSMSFVKMNADNAQISLKELSDQIEKVGSSAVEAGKNSEEAITSFRNTTEMLTKQVTDTAGAPKIAGNLQTLMQRNLPKALATDENIQGLAGTLSQQNIMMQAALTGQDPRQLMNQVALDESGNTGLGIISGSVEQAAKVICTAGGTSVEEFKATVDRMYGGRHNLTPDEQLAVLDQFPGINPYVIQTVFSQFNISVTQSQVVPMFFEGALGNLSGLGSGETTGKGFIGDVANALSKASSQGSAGLAATGGVIKGGFKQDIRDTVTGQSTLANIVGGGGANNTAAFSAYEKYATSSGDRNTYVEGLLKSGSDITKASGQTLDQSKFNTSQGDKTLAEIINSPALMAELGKGSISLQGEGNTSVDIDKWTGAASSATSATTPTGAADKSGGMTLDLTPEAKKLFKLTGPSDAQRDGVPAIGRVSPQSWF